MVITIIIRVPLVTSRPWFVLLQFGLSVICFSQSPKQTQQTLINVMALTLNNHKKGLGVKDTMIVARSPGE